MNTIKNQLIEVIAKSQDGTPYKALAAEVSDDRLVGVADNLNRLLADTVNNGVGAYDLYSIAQDLDYAREQLNRAWEAVSLWLDKRDEAAVLEKHVGNIF